MAREGYLILDSDLNMMEPDDLWARYLDEPYRANAPRFFGAQQQKLADDPDDKSNADVIEGMEVHGLAIPVHGKMSSAAAWVDDYPATSRCCSRQSSGRSSSVTRYSGIISHAKFSGSEGVYCAELWPLVRPCVD
jgi:hypothetical protein